MCVSKIEDMQRFYETSQETQKFLTQQASQFNEDILREETSTVGANSPNQQPETAVKEVTSFIQNNPSSAEGIPPSGLTANKLLETAIKDTCILSEEDSEETDDLDDQPEDPADLSGEFMVQIYF